MTASLKAFTVLVLACAAATVAQESAVAQAYGPRSEEERLIAEQIKQEDAQEEQRGEIQLVSLDGKLHLENVADPQALPWVIGHLATEKRAYQLLLDSPAMLGELRGLNGQKVRLSGRVRADGRYFVVTSLYRPVNIPSARPKRGGL